MNSYKYTAISKSGVKVSGIMGGYNEADAISRIKQENDIVIKISEVKEKKENFLTRDISGGKINIKALSMMCSQFAIIIKAGVPIARTVQLISARTTDKTLKKILAAVSEDVENGRSIATSFEDHGNGKMPLTFIETIRAGEASGNLDRAFEEMAVHYDKQVAMAGKVKNALTYPIFVLVIAVVVVFVLMIKVVPTFTDIFDSYGADLPVITKILIDISNFLAAYWAVILGVIAFLILIYRLYTSMEKGRLKAAQLKLKLPVLGNINVLNAACQFAHNLSTLIGAGLPLNNAVKITAKVIDNYYISTEVAKFNGELEEGHGLGESMRNSGCLPDILTDMVCVGEETGELEETLKTIGNYYDSELDMAVKQALGKLEPTLLIVIAGIAGFIVVAIYMAMFEMYGVM